MSHDLTAQTVLFPDLAAKQLVVKMDEEHSSSDGVVCSSRASTDASG